MLKGGGADFGARRAPKWRGERAWGKLSFPQALSPRGPALRPAPRRPPYKERASFSLNAVFSFNGHVNFAEGISRILLEAVFGIYS